MRLEAESKMGYYPAADAVARMIGNMLSVVEGERINIIDPCMGKGEALYQISEALREKGAKVFPYGIELDSTRYEDAKTRMIGGVEASAKRFLSGAAEFAKISSGSMGFLYLNPPFNDGGKEQDRWLRFTSFWMPMNSIIAFVTTEDSLRGGDLPMTFSTRYELLGLYTFPADMRPYKEVVAFGKRREYTLSSRDTNNEFITYFADEWYARNYRINRKPLLPLSETVAAPVITVPHTKPATKFSMDMPNLDTSFKSMMEAGIDSSKTWADLTTPRPLSEDWEPLMDVREGHVPNLMAVGILENLPIIDAEYGRIIVKGYGTKEKGAPTVEHTGTSTTTTEVETAVVHLNLFNIDTGVVTEFSTKEADKFEDFLMRHIDLFRNVIFKLFTPLFNASVDLPKYLPWIAKFQSPGVMSGATRIMDTKGDRFRVLSKHAGYYKALADDGSVIDVAYEDVTHTFRLMMPAQVLRAAAVAKYLEKRADASGILATMGCGKAQPLTAWLLTPTGWTTMGEVKVGDQVVGSDGKGHTVIGVFPQGEKDIYRVTFSDGSSTETCDEHLWTVQTPDSKFHSRGFRTYTLNTIRQRLTESSGNSRHYIPLVQPVEFQPHRLPLDPYLLGALLGDGGLSGGGVRFTTADSEMVEYIRAALPSGVEITKVPGDNYDYSISSGVRFTGSNPVRQTLVGMGLMQKSEHKFVPDVYLTATIQDRVALLQGLLDTDGTVASGSNVEFDSVSPQLARDVVFLVQSLGGTAKVTTKKTTYTYNGEKRPGQLCYRVNIKIANGNFAPFRLTRKASLYQPRTKYQPTRAIRSVKFVGRKEAQCIMVDSPDQLYVTDDFILTHNTTMALLAYQMLLRERLERAFAGEGQQKFVILAPAIMQEKWAREATSAFEKIGKPHIVFPGKEMRREDHWNVSANGKEVLCNYCGTKAKALPKSMAARKSLLCANAECRAELINVFKNEARDIDEAMNEPGVSIIIMTFEDAKLDSPWRAAGVPAVERLKKVAVPGGKFRYHKQEMPEDIVCCPKCGGKLSYEVKKSDKGVVKDDDGRAIVRAAEFFGVATKRKMRCSCRVKTFARDEVTRETIMEEREVTYTRLAAKGGVELVQDVEMFVNDQGQRDQRPRVDGDGNPVMVEYRRGTKYVDLGKMEYRQETITETRPVETEDECGELLYQFTRMNDFKKPNWFLRSTEMVAEYRGLGKLEYGYGDILSTTAKREIWHFRRDSSVFDEEWNPADNEGRGSARMANGDYIAQHYARRFYLIADEMHKFKGQSSIGRVYGLLVAAAKKSIPLTGSVYGGKASTVFELFYRSFAKFRNAFQHDQEDRFIEKYGIYEYTTKEYELKEKSFGAKSFKQEHSKDEGNGAHPGIVKWVLPYFAQADLEDLEIELPLRNEIFHALGMPEDVDPELAVGSSMIKAQYEQAAQEAFMGDRSRLSAWIQAELGWVICPDQDERWIHPKYRDEAKKLRAKGLNDEAEVLELANTEVWARGINVEGYESSVHGRVADECLKQWEANGEKSLIGVSGLKRPAGKHFYNACKKRGLNVVYMTSQGDTEASKWCAPEDLIRCKPAEREQIINDRKADIQVMITNPQLVEVGIELTFVNHVHTVGVPSPSLYTMVQFFGRVYRPGQDKEVTFHYWFYGNDPAQDLSKDNHLQALWMMMLSDKMDAAGIVTGDVSSTLSAISAQAHGKSLIKDLQKHLLDGDMPKWNGNKVSYRKQIVRNPKLVELEHVMEDFDLARQMGVPAVMPTMIDLAGAMESRGSNILADTVSEDEPQQVETVSVRDYQVPILKGRPVNDDGLELIPEWLLRQEDVPSIGAAIVNKDWQDKIVYAKLFTPDADWYFWVAEVDQLNGEVYGYAVLNGDMQNAEWGYQSYDSLADVRGQYNMPMERDTAFRPATIRAALADFRTRFGEVEETRPVEVAPVEPEPLPFVFPTDNVTWTLIVPLHTIQDRRIA